MDPGTSNQVKKGKIMTSLNDYIKHKFSQSDSSQGGGYGSNNDGNNNRSSDDNNVIMTNGSSNNNNSNSKNNKRNTSTTSSSLSSIPSSDNNSETGVLLVSTPLGGGRGGGYDGVMPTSNAVVAFADDSNNNNDDNISSGGGSGSMSGHSTSISIGSKNYTLRRLAMDLSLYCNLFITLTKLVAYLRTFSLSVLAALLDSVLDVVSQLVLNYTEKHSSMQRSSALYPAGASRLEPIGVLTCAALMGVSVKSFVRSFVRSFFRSAFVSVCSMFVFNVEVTDSCLMK